MPVLDFGSKRETRPGTILIWTGALADIPTGWTLCDGNDGAPDLLGRFLRGRNLGDTGQTAGTASYTLTEDQMAYHGHTGTTDPSGQHRHILHTANEGNIVDDSGAYAAENDEEIEMNPAGLHTHDLSSDSTGSGEAIDNIPLHYEVAFIMKT